MNKNKKNGSRVLQGLLLATTAITGSTIIAATAAMASGPSGGTVVVGSATITSPSSTQTVINQSSKKALINWNSFSISAGSSVTFNQPNSKSLTVNRVTGPNASAIDGQLLANGSVWLINANGILFGQGSQINVGALIATTSDLSDDDFKSGNYSFSKASSNPNASVTNLGTITTSAGGSVVLSAPSVSNAGLIQANLGSVVLGGASTFTVDMTGDNLLRYQISAPVAQTPTDANGNAQSALVSNAGTIIANGGSVVMTARAAQGVQDDVINNTGMVQATSVSSHNGEIDLDAGPNGTVNDSGTLDASGTASKQVGGTVTITGQNVNVADNAKINASGDAGGGMIEIGGGLHGQGAIANAQNTTVGNATIVADAITSGNGGTVSVWSSGNTSFNGSISARGGSKGGNGGQVETSGNNLAVGNNATVDTTAPLGLTGDWLLDPNNIYVQATGTDPTGCSASSCTIAPNTVTTALGTTNVTLQASSLIDVLSSINYSSTHTLSLISGGAIDIDAPVINRGAGAIDMFAGGNIAIESTVRSQGGNVVVVAGSDGDTNLTDVTQPGFYGSGAGSVTIGGSGAGGDVFVGSASGTTSIYGYNVDVDAEAGNAQIGYGSNTFGNVNVYALNEVSIKSGSDNTTAQIGNGGNNAFGAVGGDIYIQSGGDILLEADGTGSNAIVGNVSASNTGSPTGNTGTQSGNITLVAGDPDSYGLELHAVGNGSSASIGNFALGSNAGDAGDASGTISVTAYDGIEMRTDGNDGASAVIGNGSTYNSTTEGTIGINTDGIFLDANSDNSLVRVGDTAYGSVNQGSDGTNTVTITATDDDYYVGEVYVTATGQSSSAVIGGYSQAGDVAGDTNINADGDIYVNSGGTSSLAQIGSSGLGAESNISVTAGNDIEITAEGNSSTAQVGNSSVADSDDAIGGDVAIESTGSYVDLYADGTSSTARIGNYNGFFGNSKIVSGDVTVTSDSNYDGADYYSAIDVEANGDYSFAQIGDGGGSQQSIGGDVTLSAYQVNLSTGYICQNECEGGDHLPTGAILQIGNGGDGTVAYMMNGTVSVNTVGEIQIDAEGPSDYIQIGNGGHNSSTTYTSGDVTVASTNGDIDITTEDSGTVQIGNGGSISNGNYSGTIDVEALNGDISVSTSAPSDEGSPDYGSETPAYVQIGNGGEYSNLDPDNGFSDSGDITVKAQNITLETHNDESNIQIGNGGYCAGAATAVCNASDYTYDSTYGSISFDGSITVAASDSLTLQTDGYNDSVSIGNGGDISAAGLGVYDIDPSVNDNITTSGDINVTVGQDTTDTANATAGTLTMYATSGGDSTVRIGNGGVGADSNSSATGAVSVGGDITVNVLGGTDDEGSLTHSGSAALTSDGEEASTVVIGNVGGTDDAPYVSGDIGVTVDGDLSFNNVTGDSLVIAGNIGQSGYVSGSVTLNAQTIEDVGASVANDIPNGDVTVEVLGDEGVNIDDENDFYSSYDLTVLSVGDITIGGALRNLQSNGGGAITLVAGWDGSTTDLGVLTTVDGGAYGNDGGSVIVGGQTGSSNGSEVADVSGNLTIEGYDVTVEADNGTAQIGYTGDNYGWGNNTGTQTGDGNGDVPGTITVNATHDVNVTGGSNSDNGYYAQIGNGGVAVVQTDDGPGYIRTAENGSTITVNADNDVNVTGGGNEFAYAQIGNGGAGTTDNTGDIYITAGGDLTLTGKTGNAQIGDGGDEANGVANGNININVTGDIELDGSEVSGSGFAQIGNGGQYSEGTAGGGITVTANNVTLNGGYASSLYAQIGNGAADGSYEGDASGDISITASGDISASDGGGVGWIGNNADIGEDGSTSGNVTLIGSSISLSETNLASDLGNGDENDNGGDVFLGYTNASGSSYAATFDGVTYDSGNSLTLAATGDLIIDGDVQNAGGGDVTLIGGWDGSTTDVSAIIANDDSEYGNNNATITIGGLTDPSVGSAGGTTTVVSDNLTVDASNENAQIGYNDGDNDAGGDIDITLTGALALTASDDNTAQIGNGTYGNNPGGDVTITANSISNTASTDVTGDNVSLDITGEDNAIGSSDQPLDVAVNNLTITTNGGDAYVNSPNQGFNIGVSDSGIELNGGDLYLSANGGITQDASIDANSINVGTSSGSITLGDDDNNFGYATIASAGNATVHDGESLEIESASVDSDGGTLTLVANGNLTQGSGSISAPTLNATANSGSITFTNSDNAISNATLYADGDATLDDSSALEIDGATVGNGDTLTLYDTGTGGITQGAGSGNAITATNLNVTTTAPSNGGSVVLDNASNSIGTAIFSATGDVTLDDSAALTLNGASLAGYTLTLVDTATGGIGQGSASTNAIVASGLDATATNGGITLTNHSNAVSNASFSAGGNVNFYDTSALEVDGASLAGHTLTLTDTADGGITQGAGSGNAITATNLNVTTTAPSNGGSVVLDNASNSIGTAIFSATGDVTLDDSAALTLNGASLAGYTLTLVDTATGGIGQGSASTNAIVASGLDATATNGGITLTNHSNAVSNASFSAGGNVNFYDTSALEVDGASLAGHTLTLTDTADGGITQGSNAGITASAVNATATSGAVTLDNSNNAIGHATISATTDATLDDSVAVEIDGVSVGDGNTFTVADTGGNITQGTGSANAITAPSVDVTASSGSINLNNANNAISNASLTSSGSATLYDAEDLAITGVSVGNNLTLLTTGNLTFISSAQLSTGNLLAVAGWDGHTTSSSALTTGNTFGNNSGSITIGGDSADGDVAVGSQSGSTTLAGDNITLDAENGYSQLGYHGAGGGDIYAYAKGDIVVQATDVGDYALLGNGTGGEDVSGDETGNIYLLAVGEIQLNSVSDSDEIATPWIGNHTGSSGIESGNLTIVAQDEQENCGTGDCGFGVGEMVEAALGSTANSGSGGDVVIAYTNPENNGLPVMTITDGFNYNSPHNLTVVSGNSMYIDSSLQNSGSGDITLISGWNSGVVTGQNIITAAQANSTVSSLFSSKSSYGQTNNGDTNKGSIEIGCDVSDTTCSTNTAAVGSANGTTTVLTNNLNITAGAGLGAQLGYHGAGSGTINVTAQGNVALTGGSVLGSYAQIGDGGYQVTGNTSDDITVNAGGIVQLDGGTGQEAYAQIGNGGAESNSNVTGGYSDTGMITVTGQSVVLQAGAVPTTTATPAGTLSAAYAQIGNGGYKSGQNLDGTATIGGDINVTVNPPSGNAGVALLGNGADAYAQIGNGGDDVNYLWTGNSSGTIDGDIAVSVTDVSQQQRSNDLIQMVGGTGGNAYVQIGNGGHGENTPASGTAVSFAVSGSLTVDDLKLWGGNGTDNFGQIGNGDNDGTGYGNVSGGINIGGTDFNLKNGNGSGDTASIGNNTGHGSITNNFIGYPPSGPTGPDAGEQGAISSTTQIPTIPTGFDITTVIITPGVGSSPANENGSGGSTPLEQIADGNGEGSQDSDGAADSLGNSLNGHKGSNFARVIIPGVLMQIVTIGSHSPNGVPPADVDYSSWGNEALWRW